MAEDRVRQLAVICEWENQKVNGLYVPGSRSVTRDGLHISVAFTGGIAVEECVIVPYEDFRSLTVDHDGQATYASGAHAFRDTLTVPFDPGVPGHRYFAKKAAQYASFLFPY